MFASVGDQISSDDLQVTIYVLSLNKLLFIVPLHSSFQWVRAACTSNMVHTSYRSKEDPSVKAHLFHLPPSLGVQSPV